MFALAS